MKRYLVLEQIGNGDVTTGGQPMTEAIADFDSQEDALDFVSTHANAANLIIEDQFADDFRDLEDDEMDHLENYYSGFDHGHDSDEENHYYNDLYDQDENDFDYDKGYDD